MNLSINAPAEIEDAEVLKFRSNCHADLGAVNSARSRDELVIEIKISRTSELPHQNRSSERLPIKNYTAVERFFRLLFFAGCREEHVHQSHYARIFSKAYYDA